MEYDFNRIIYFIFPSFTDIDYIYRFNEIIVLKKYNVNPILKYSKNRKWDIIIMKYKYEIIIAYIIRNGK